MRSIGHRRSRSCAIGSPRTSDTLASMDESDKQVLQVFLWDELWLQHGINPSVLQRFAPREPHNDCLSDAERSARANRNKCRRPSAASYAGFVLERNEAACFGAAGELHPGCLSRRSFFPWKCRPFDDHSLLSARLLLRKAPGDLFESRKEMTVSSSNRAFFSERPRNFSDARHS